MGQDTVFNREAGVCISIALSHLEETAMSKRVYQNDQSTQTNTVMSNLEMIATSVITPRPVYGCLPESAKAVRKRVQLAVQRGDFPKAIAMLNRLIIQGLGTAEDFNNRGLVHLWNSHPHKAIRDFNHAIRLNPELPAAYNNRANYYATLDDQQNALADYDRAIDLNPFHVRARINRGITLRKLGRLDEALEGLDDALMFHQLNGEAYAERGRTYHLRGDWNCAIADYRRALATLPTAIAETTGVEPSYRYRVMTWMSDLSTVA